MISKLFFCWVISANTLPRHLMWVFSPRGCSVLWLGTRCSPDLAHHWLGFTSVLRNTHTLYGMVNVRFKKNIKKNKKLRMILKKFVKNANKGDLFIVQRIYELMIRILWKKYSEMKNNDRIKSQFCICWAVMACAKLWRDQNIRIKIRANGIWFWLWDHKPLVKWFHRVDENWNLLWNFCEK